MQVGCFGAPIFVIVVTSDSNLDLFKIITFKITYSFGNFALLELQIRRI